MCWCFEKSKAPVIYKYLLKALLASIDEEISVLNVFKIDWVFSTCSLILSGSSIKELTDLNKSFGLHLDWSNSGITSFPAAILIILAYLTFTKDLTIK